MTKTFLFTGVLVMTSLNAGCFRMGSLSLFGTGNGNSNGSDTNGSTGTGIPIPAGAPGKTAAVIEASQVMGTL